MFRGSAESVLPLDPYAEFLVDAPGSLEIDHILSAARQREFKPSSASPPSFGFTRAAIWMRCEIRADSSSAIPLIASLRNARPSRIEWFVVADGHVEQTLVGGSLAPSDSPARFSSIAFEIPAGETRTLYARMTSDTSRMLPFVAGSPEALPLYEFRRSVADLFIVGFCISAAAFLLMLGIIHRHNMFYNLAVFAFIYSVYYLIYHGYVRAIWPGRPLWIERGGFGFTSAIGIFSFIRFSGAYLEVQTLSRSARLLQTAAETLLLFAAFSFTFLSFFDAIRLLNLCIALSVLAGFAVLILRWRQSPKRNEKWFYLSWISFCISIGLILLKTTGYLPLNMQISIVQNFLVPAILAMFFFGTLARQRRLQHLEIQLAEAEARRVQAEQERDAKSLFLANVSHEIRTPLSAIVGLSQAMWLRCETTAPDSEFTGFLNRVRSGGHYLSLLLRNLLNASASESGRAPVSLNEFYLADWIEEVRNILEPLADYHGGRLKWILPSEEEFRFCTDEMRLSQILLNLADNALKFGAASGEPVTLRLEPWEEGLRMTVEDRGPGIPTERRDSLFTPFQKTGTPSQPTATGVGLGLSVVKLNTELLHGSLTVEARAEGGMRFTVFIPASLSSTPQLSL